VPPAIAAKVTDALELTVLPAASSSVAVATQGEPKATVEQPVTATWDADPALTVKLLGLEATESPEAVKVPAPARTPVRVTCATPFVNVVVLPYPERVPGPVPAAKVTPPWYEVTVLPPASSRVAVAVQVEPEVTVVQPVMTI
jgi:hypothetical protein